MRAAHPAPGDPLSVPGPAAGGAAVPSAVERLTGRTWPPAGTYLVGREEVRRFAVAVGADHPWHHDVTAARAAGHGDVVAPPTYAVVVTQRADALLFADPEAGLDFSRVVHGEQSFEHHAPIVAGDELVTSLTVDRARLVGGNLMLTLRDEVATVTGEPRCTAVSTLVVRGEE